MEQPRERIDIRGLEGAAEPDRRSGRIGHDNLAAIIAIELRGDLRQRRLVELQHPVAPRQGIRNTLRCPLRDQRRGAIRHGEHAAGARRRTVSGPTLSLYIVDPDTSLHHRHTYMVTLDTNTASGSKHPKDAT